MNTEQKITDKISPMRVGGEIFWQYGGVVMYVVNMPAMIMHHVMCIVDAGNRLLG